MAPRLKWGAFFIENNRFIDGKSHLQSHSLRLYYSKVFIKLSHFDQGVMQMSKDVLTHDDRYKIANREALIGVGLAIFNFLWWYGFAYGLGSKDPSEYTFILGFPAWFFYSCILGFIVMVILVTVIVKFWFVEVPLDAEINEEENE